MKNLFKTNSDIPQDTPYTQNLKQLKEALDHALHLYMREISRIPQGEETATTLQEQQVNALERVRVLADVAANEAYTRCEIYTGAADGMQVYRNENVPPRDPIEQGYKFFKITFQKESSAELVADTHREGQLNMGIWPNEEDYKTFKAMFTRLDGLPMVGESSWLVGRLHADPESWEWDIAERMRRTCGRAKLDSTKFHKIYRRGNTIFIGVKPTGK